MSGMNSFEYCQRIEEQGYELVKPYLGQNFDEYVYVNTVERNELVSAFQQNFGDLIVKKNKALFFIDLKTETEDKYGNLFLETWSNKKRRTPGWFPPEVGVKADFVYYIFLKQRTLYILDLPKLRKWAFEDGNIEDYPEKMQNKYDQLNDTWGRCVKIKDLINAELCLAVKL
jgi:hypothetical protein